MKKTFNIALILMIMVLNCGAGYIDPPPTIGNHTSGIPTPPKLPKVPTLQPDVQEAPVIPGESAEPIIPMAPTVIPVVITKKGKYSEYLKDLNDVIPLLEDMRNVLTTQDKDIQMFCAKANKINLYAEAIKSKYGNKTERNYESFKQLGILNKNLSDTADYWRYTYKYNKLLRGSVKAKEADQRLMSSKLIRALTSINTTLEILKENTRADN